jgi:hypothetical protein
VSSFVAWAIGSVVLALTIWKDATHSGSGGDVGAGFAGLAFLIGVGVFTLSTTIGAALGAAATRRGPTERSADVAFGLNVVTLVGVLLGGFLLFFI